MNVKDWTNKYYLDAQGNRHLRVPEENPMPRKKDTDQAPEDIQGVHITQGRVEAFGLDQHAAERVLEAEKKRQTDKDTNWGRLVTRVTCRNFAFRMILPGMKTPAVVTCAGDAIIEVRLDEDEYTAVIDADENPLLGNTGFFMYSTSADISDAITEVQDMLARNFKFYHVAPADAMTVLGRKLQMFFLQAVYGDGEPSAVFTYQKDEESPSMPIYVNEMGEKE